MQTYACAWINRWTKNGGKSGPGRRAIMGRGSPGRWAFAGRRGPWTVGLFLAKPISLASFQNVFGTLTLLCCCLSCPLCHGGGVVGRAGVSAPYF